MKTRIAALFILLAGYMVSPAISQVVPKIISVSAPETLGASHYRGSIATDSLDQPHIITTEGSAVSLYDKIGGTWRSESFSSALFNSSQYGNPALQIGNDGAWYSGVLWGNSFGFGIIYRRNISTSPTPVASSLRTPVRPSPGKWDAGNLSLDPAFPNRAIVSTMAGYYMPVTFQNNTLSIGSRGQMYAGEGGEKNAFWISKAGSVQHSDGLHAVWHGAIGGYPLYSSAYRNSRMGGPVTWALDSTYSAQGDDGQYVNVSSDNVVPEIGYMVATYAGVVMNIWNGSKMVFPANNLLVIDPAGSWTARRYAPRLAPAKTGGVYVLWTRGGRLMLRFVSQEGIMGETRDLGQGVPGDICVDSTGNIHIFYNNNGTRYIKIEVMADATRWVSTAQDFNADDKDDLAVYDPKAGNWFIRQVADSAGSLLAWNMNWGFLGALPVPGDFNGDGRADLAVYEAARGLWYFRSLNSSFVRSGYQWGYAGTIAVPGDYDDDGISDLAVFAPRDGMWHVRSIAKEQLLVKSQWGFSTGIPVPGDYDGDGTADLAVFDTAKGDWYISKPDRNLLDNSLWGFAGVQSVKGDYNGDGTDDLAVYDASGGKWYIRNTHGSLISWAFSHGYAGTIAVPGDYDGDGKHDLAVFDPNSGRWFIRSLNGAVIGWNIDWGFKGAVPVSGDFNGDGKHDLAVYDPINGRWYIRGVNGDTLGWSIDWGSFGMRTVSGDFDGDGKDDLAVYSPSTQRWFIRSLAGQTLAWNLQWGFAGGIPSSGDFNGNGRSDLAIYNPGNAMWYVRTLAGAVIMNGFQAGIQSGSSIPAPGDYDGDGVTDPGSFLNGRWSAVERGKTLVWKLNWGWEGAIPVAGDFNGDGVSDLAVYDEAAGNWYIRSVSGGLLANPVQWGFNQTLPVTGDFNGNGRTDLGVFGTDAGNWYIRTLTGTVLRWNLDWGTKGHIPIGSIKN